MKKLLKYGLVFIMFLVLLILLIAFASPLESFLEWKYDRTSQNPSIQEKQDMMSIIDALPIVSFQNMDSTYLSWSKSTIPKYKSMLKGSQYRVLKRKDFFKKIVGDFRINDFVCRDRYYRACLLDSSKEYYWLIDEKVLTAVIELRHSLKSKGYDPNGFSITSGHRHPRRNEKVRAAKLSRHMKGQAVDIFIMDIDKDGKYTAKDKQIVLDIAEKEVIGNKGGIGRYPGTRAVHIDVRGTRARWDTY